MSYLDVDGASVVNEVPLFDFVVSWENFLIPRGPEVLRRFWENFLILHWPEVLRRFKPFFGWCSQVKEAIGRVSLLSHYIPPAEVGDDNAMLAGHDLLTETAEPYGLPVTNFVMNTWDGEVFEDGMDEPEDWFPPLNVHNCGVPVQFCHQATVDVACHPPAQSTHRIGKSSLSALSLLLIRLYRPANVPADVLLPEDYLFHRWYTAASLATSAASQLVHHRTGLPPSCIRLEPGVLGSGSITDELATEAYQEINALHDADHGYDIALTRRQLVGPLSPDVSTEQKLATELVVYDPVVHSGCEVGTLVHTYGVVYTVRLDQTDVSNRLRPCRAGSRWISSMTSLKFICSALSDYLRLPVNVYAVSALNPPLAATVPTCHQIRSGPVGVPAVTFYAGLPSTQISVPDHDDFANQPADANVVFFY